MQNRTTQYIADATAGRLTAGDPAESVHGISTDSRAVRPGDLFIALKGERFDAHGFLDQVAAAGAGAVLVENGRGPGTPGCAVIEVKDTRRAMGRLAAAYRADFDLPVVAVAGSNGKTSTKELIAAQLRELGPVVWSEASFNNDIGVPLTLLKLAAEHRALVQEIGTNHPGEMAPLIAMARPSHGVVTSIGREHLEHFDNLEGVLAEQCSLPEMLPADGVLFLPGDDPHADTLAAKTRARVVRVGFGEVNDWRIHDADMTLEGMAFSLRFSDEAHQNLTVPLLGRHQVVNAAIAFAVGAELGVPFDRRRSALAASRGPKQRLQLWTENGVRVLDDSYNANADSMTAALHTLAELPCSGRRIAALGDMGELGRHSEAAHREIGAVAAQLGIDMLFAIGAMAYCYGGAAREAGMGVVSEFDEMAAAADSLRATLRPGDTLLIKGSRAAALERITSFLRGNLEFTEEGREPDEPGEKASDTWGVQPVGR